MPITVLVVDDSKIMQEAILRFLAQETAIKVIGTASDFAQAVQMANDLKPQVIVLDLHMPRGNSDGEIKPRLNGSRVLAMSLSNDDEAKALAANVGAAVLLDKMNLFCELVPTIIQLASSTSL